MGMHVAIIGGGIAGLAAAYTLQEKARALQESQGSHLPITFTLFESDARLGGKILSEQADGFTIEGGPDSFLLQKPWAAQVAQAVGLESDLIGTNPREKKLYVINKGRLTPMPDGVMLIIPTRFMPFITSPLISWPGKIRMGMDFFIPRRKDDEDESIGDFIRRRLGKEALEKIAEPLLSGIHVSDPEMQSLLGTFPRFRNLEKQHGSLIRGMLAQRRASLSRVSGSGRNNGHTNGNSHGSGPGGGISTSSSWKNSVFVSLRGGMGELVQGIQRSLPAEQVRTGCRVTEVTPLMDGGYRLSTANGETLLADAVVFATPAFITADLVSPFAAALSRALAGIRYVSTATVSLGYRVADLGTANPLNGVGFIIPRKENRRISACTMSSIKFSSRAPEGQLLLRCFVGGPGREEAVELDDETIIANTRAELAALMGITAGPVVARVFRWIKGNAQYDVGHLDRVHRMQEMAAQIPGLFLTGSAYEGIGVPDCIHQGQQVAEKVLVYLQERQDARIGERS